MKVFGLYIKNAHSLIKKSGKSEEYQVAVLLGAPCVTHILASFKLSEDLLLCTQI